MAPPINAFASPKYTYGVDQDIVYKPSETYLEKARAKGVDTSKVSTLLSLVEAFRWAELRVQCTGGNYVPEMAEKAGVSQDTIRSWRGNPYIELAMEIVAEHMIAKMVESDLRHELLQLYHKDTIPIFTNMMNIAAGRPYSSGALPAGRDQVAAASWLFENMVGTGFVKQLFAIEDVESPELLHLKQQERLSSAPVLAIDAEEVKH